MYRCAVCNKLSFPGERAERVTFATRIVRDMETGRNRREITYEGLVHPSCAQEEAGRRDVGRDL